MRYIVNINSFDGGLNTKVPATQLAPNESPSLQNVEFDDIGAVGTRLGMTIVNTAAVGAFDLLHSYKYNAGSKLIGVYGSVYKLSGTSFFVVTESTGVMTTGVRVHAENCQGYVFLGNGTSEYKWNGTDFTRWGCQSGSTAFITSIVSGASTLAGSAGTADYAYRIAFINSTNVEGLASPVKTFTVTGTCSVVNLSFDLPPASHGINYIAVYRNDYLLGTVTASVATITDTLATLTTARDQTIGDFRPPNITIFLYHGGYMFGVEENTTNLYYSDINSPESWDPTNYFRIGDSDGYTIRGMAIYNNGLIIAKEDGFGNGTIWVLYMPDSNPDNWSLEQLDLSYGGVAPLAIKRFGTFLMILNRNGIYDMSTTSMGIINSAPISFKIQPDIDALVMTYLTNSVAVVYKNRIWVSVCSSGSINDLIYQYDYVRGIADTDYGAWSKFVDLEMKTLCIHDGELLGMDYTGYVYTLDTGHTDNGTAIDSNFSTSFNYGLDEHRQNMKVWRFIYMTLQASGAWNLTVEWRGVTKTYMESSGTVDLTPGGAEWGLAEWGVSVWGKDKDIIECKIPIHVVSQAIQVKVSINTAGQYFKLYRMALHYNLRGAR